MAGSVGEVEQGFDALLSLFLAGVLAFFRKLRKLRRGPGMVKLDFFTRSALLAHARCEAWREVKALKGLEFS